MLILILIICIATCIFGFLLDEKCKHDTICIVGYVLARVSIVISVISVIAILLVSIDTVELSVVESKIEMYQKENKAIETQIDEIVKNYMKYENNTFKEFKTESSVTIVSLYPELKSDTLVKSQIETYTKNNNKIKGLKEKKIMRSVYRWWLYFGK